MCKNLLCQSQFNYITQKKQKTFHQRRNHKRPVTVQDRINYHIRKVLTLQPYREVTSSLEGFLPPKGGGGAGRLEARVALLRSGVVRGVATDVGVAIGGKGVGTLGFLARVGGTGLAGVGLLGAEKRRA